MQGKIADELLDSGLALPGTAITIVALPIGGEDVLLVIGLFLLLSGGAVKFGRRRPALTVHAAHRIDRI